MISLLGLSLFFVVEHQNYSNKHLLAATNNYINFQARILRDTGSVVPDGFYDVEFRIYDDDDAGSLLWTETYNSGSHQLRIVNGYVTTSLGSVHVFDDHIPDWSEELWITININNDGEMDPRMKITAVPYAMKAYSASNLKVTNGAFTSTLSVTPPTVGDQTFVLPDLASATSATIITTGNLASITAVGTISSGTWQGGTIAVGNGGTGATSFTTNGILYGNGANPVQVSAASGTGTYCLSSTDGGAPTWGSCGAGSGNYIDNQNSLQQSANFWISGTGRADTSFATILLDTPTAVALDVGTSNATQINLNKSVTVTGNLTFASGANRTLSVASNAAGAGYSLTLQGGNAGSGNTNGGDLTLSAGARSGSGTSGRVIIKPQAGNDSATAFQVQNAAGSGYALNVDTTNIRIGINTNAPSADLTFGAGSNRTINVLTQTASNTAGNNLTIQAATGNGTGAGGTLNLNGGAAAAALGSNGGGVIIAAAPGSNVSNGGSGGAVSISSGAGRGTADNTGGNMTISTGAGSQRGAGGSISLTAGDGGTYSSCCILDHGNGGAISLTAGAGASGGNVTITAGSGVEGGDYDLPETYPGTAGNIFLIAGSVAGEGTGGSITLSAGSATTTNGQVIIKNTANSTNAFQVQNAAGTAVILNVDTINQRVGIGTALPSVKLDISGVGVTTEGSLGSELVTNGTFTGNANSWTSGGSVLPANNWAYNSNNVIHTAGSTTSLSQSLSLSSGTYQVTYSVSSRTTGSVTAVLRGWSGQTVSYNVTNFTENITIDGNGSIDFIPSSDFDGIIDNVSVKRLTQTSALQVMRNSDNTIGLEVRSGGSGYYSTFVGVNAGASGLHNSGSEGYYNSAFGYNALRNNTTGYYNSAFGYNSLQQNTTGVENVAIGSSTLSANRTGSYNVAIGHRSLVVNTTGSDNVAIGNSSLLNNSSGGSNVAIGNLALASNTTGGGNVSMGLYALMGSTTASFNTALGNQAARNTTSSDNSVVGAFALSSNTTGTANVSFGNNSMVRSLTGSYNTALGPYALESALSSNYNIGLGFAPTLGYSPAATTTAAIAAGGSVDVGTHYYKVSYVINGRETNLDSDWSVTTATTTSGNQTVNLSNVPTYSGPFAGGTITRNVYRTKVGNGSTYYYVGNINNNTTTTYTDTAADSTINSVYTGPSNSIMIGARSSAMFSNQMVLGSNDYTITESYWGGGIVAASPQNFGFYGTSGSGTNITGASMLFGAGRGTGSGAGGDIIFQTAAAGSAGSNINNWAEVMRITSAGNVGIGTSSPTTAKLVVKGTTSDNTAASLNVTDNSDASLLYVRNDGNIGIGTTNPQKLLEITASSTTEVSNFRLTNSSWTANQLNTMEFYSGTPSGSNLITSAIKSKLYGGGASGELQFWTNNNSTLTQQMTILNNGNVGIGTVAPGTRLTVVGSSSVPTISGSNSVTASWDFTDGSGWTAGGSALPANNWAVTSSAGAHTSGATTALSGTTSTSNGTMYKIMFDVTAGGGCGYISVALGGASAGGTWANPATDVTSYVRATSNNGAITFTPDSCVSGSIDNVRIYAYTSNSTPEMSVYGSAENYTPIEFRTGGGGNSNIFIGQGSGQLAIAGENTAVGTAALSSITYSAQNTVMGAYANYQATTGGANSAFGHRALNSNVTGSGNTSIGRMTLYSNITGGDNVTLGNSALYSLQSGNYNTAIGNNAGYSNVTGSSNVFLGRNAGYFETGSNKLFIDNQQRASEADARTKALIYGIFDSTVANQYLTLNGQLQVAGVGNSYIYGSLGVGGITSPSAFLQLAAPTSSAASLRLTASSAVDPSSPNIGDLWFNGTNLYFRKDGSTSQDLLAGAGCPSCIYQAPITTAQNTIQPATSAVVGLTVNGTNTGTAAQALVVNQAYAADGINLNLTNTSGTQTSGMQITRNGAGGTTTSLLGITNTDGTATNGILFTGTIGTDIATASGKALTITANAASTWSTTAGDLTLQAGSGTIVSGSHILPSTDDTYDLGSSSYRWRDLYLGPTSLHLSSTVAETTTARDWKFGIQESDGNTEGNFRLVEGASELLTMTTSGNLGVGISAPTAKLQVTGTDNAASSYGFMVAPASSAELITAQVNRDFSGAGNWTGTGWTVGSGLYTHSAGANSATLANANFTDSSILAGHLYKLTFTVSNIGGATPSITPYIGAVAGTAVTANGTYTQYITATADNASLIFTPNATMTGNLDDISLTDTNTSFAITNSGGVGIGTVNPGGILEVTKPNTIASQTGCQGDNFCDTAISQGSSGNHGYQFETDVDGYITKLWVKNNGTNATNIVRLYNNLGVVLASANFSSDGISTWRSIDVTPVFIEANTTYTVSVQYSNNRHYDNTSVSYPHTYSHVTILGGVTGSNNSVMPKTPLTNMISGTPDITFIPDSTPKTEFIVKGDGKVGIGTDSPTETLDVRGEALIKSLYDDSSAFQIQDASGNSIFNVGTLNNTISINGLNTAVEDTVLTVRGGQAAGQTYVAAGWFYPGSIISSTDGINWTVTNDLSANYGAGVAFNGSMWVVNDGEAGGGTSTSPDGYNWTSRQAGMCPNGASGSGVAWNGSYWVLVCNQGPSTIYTSDDGISWTGRGATTFSTGGNDVAWNGTMWVAVGNGTANTIAYSYNGIDWTGLGKTIFSTTGYGVAWNGSMWVAVGSGTNAIATSTDGINWTGRGLGAFTGGYGESVAWNGTRWVAVGSGTSHTIAYSSDGINWNGVGKSIFSSVGHSVIWTGSFWLAGGSGTYYIATSEDGIAWTGRKASGSSENAYAVGSSTAPNLYPSIGNTATSKLQVWQNSIGGNLAVIDGTGSFGIGTSSPGTSKLRILGSDDNINGHALIAGGATTTGLAVRNDGNVGIGTISPNSAKLTIQGTTADSTTASLSVANSSGTTYIYARNDGKLGVGTTAPNATTHVVGSDSSSGNYSMLVAPVASSELITAVANRDMSAAVNWSGTGWARNSSLNTLEHTPAGANNVTLANANLTASSIKTNHMYKLTFTVSGIGGATPSITPYIGAVAGIAVTANGTYTQYIIAAANDADLIFTPNATMTGHLDDISLKDTNTSFAINNAGNIGIGTPNPSYKLEVSGNSSISGTLTLGQATPSEGGYLLFRGAGSYKSIQNDSGTLKFYNGASTIELMVIQENGNVGIGATPNSILQLAASTSTYASFRLTGGTNTPSTLNGGEMWYDTTGGVDHLYFRKGQASTTVDLLAAGSGLPSGTEGQMLYNDSGTWTAFSGMLWDDSTSRLSVGTTNSTATLNVGGNIDLYGGASAIRNIQITAQTTADTGGAMLYVKPGDGNGTGAGGELYLTSGWAGASAGARGGDITIDAKRGTDTDTGGNGGNVTIMSGRGSGTGDNNGGNITLQAGRGSGAGTDGIVLVKPLGSADSINAFMVQDAAGTTTVLAADTVNGRVGIGANPTIFTLQVAGTVGPNDDNSYDLGSSSYRWKDMYIKGGIYVYNGTNSNSVTIVAGATTSAYTLTLPLTGGNNGDCLKSSGSGTLTWGSCGGTGGGGTVRQTLYVEYAGGTFYGDGNNNSGTMNANYDTSARRNYYEWTSSQSSDQDYDIVVSTMIPSNYSSMGAASTFKVRVYQASVSGTSDITWTMYDSSGVQCFSSSMKPTSATTWESKNPASLGGCTFSANSQITFMFKLTTNSTDGAVRIGEIEYEYSN